jgi:hypothetical protein
MNIRSTVIGGRAPLVRDPASARSPFLLGLVAALVLALAVMGCGGGSNYKVGDSFRGTCDIADPALPDLPRSLTWVPPSDFVQRCEAWNMGQSTGLGANNPEVIYTAEPN